MTKKARSWAAITAAGLFAVLLPTIGLGGTASAAGSCEHESNDQIIPTFQCDDVTQPNTALQTSAPPNAAGWIRTNSVTLTFQATDYGTDTDEMTFRCAFSGPSGSFAEKTCTSPMTLSGLTDSSEPYTFRVYTVDSVDNVFTSGLFDITKEVVTKDYDESAATVTWKQDTVAPRGMIVGGPYDEITPDLPVLWSRVTKYTLGSNEKPVTPVCSVNNRPLTCQLGTTHLTGLTAGTKTFAMRLKDPAGNVDPTLRTKKFTVPYNVLGTTTERQKWTRHTGATGYFSGDYLQTRKKGAQLSKSVSFHELRILVPRGPGLGRFRIKVGDYYFRIINEASTTARHEVVVLRGPQSTLMRGVLKLYTLDAKPVQFDAIMYR